MRRLMFLVIVALSIFATIMAEGFGQDDEEDTSGKGAVLCAWLFWIDTRNTIDICIPGEFPSFREDLSWAIDAMNDFIVTNNPTPVTKAALEQFIARRLVDAQAKTVARQNSTVDCQSARAGSVGLPNQSREDFRRGIADFLSVPRKPLMRPCL